MDRALRRIDLHELAGAFGDLGTFVPLVLAYVTIVGIDAGAVLLAFGIAMIVAGAVFRTPFPVQPMKAIGAAASVQSGAAVTVAAVQAASVVTGVVWLVLAHCGVAERLGRWLPRSLAIGIVVGLGAALLLEGLRMMAAGWLIAVPLLAAAAWLSASRGPLAMLLLLAAGLAHALWQQPELRDALLWLEPGFRLPAFAWPDFAWPDLWVGLVVLALPQVPLTLGNALVATVEQNNRLFPDRPVSLRQVAASTGLMNLWAAATGGVPMCHGAGGMAAQVRFGARTGAAPIAFGMLLVAGALFFSGSIETVLRLFSMPVLGVMLVLTGWQLATAIAGLGGGASERLVTLVTAALCLWNVGVAFVCGLLLHAALRRRPRASLR